MEVTELGGDKSQPVAIATWQVGRLAVEAAGAVLRDGGRGLDAVEEGVNAVELDPTVTSAGLGGLPNAEGVVELDAAIMDGATHRAGSVGALRDVSAAISVARKVMDNTQHVMLAGESALQFALSEGFAREELLTPESRKRWEEWKGQQSETHDTIGLVALDRYGDLAAGCSTSGLAFKLPGRVGDSPIIGAGLYVDNDVGGAAATGLGEEIMKSCASFLVVEFMRGGDSPTDACRRAVERALAKLPGDKDVTIGLIALARSGECGAASTRAKFPYAVWTPDGVEVHEAE